MTNKIVPIILISLIMAGCSSPFDQSRYGVLKPLPSKTDTEPTQTIEKIEPFQLASTHYADVAKIRAEAGRLGARIKANEITKSQAAQYLNHYRINLVGRNSVDDAAYQAYLQSAVESQRGKISTIESKQLIQNRLMDIQKRWVNMPNKPNNPAFTNFLLEVMSMKPLS